ncbi:hypothetical protein E2C01_040924 [Portunus trituberculatus]|uniref:Uncharacterized protein n=1 Tax=Portunus trituberculatus TaxID=210409 RepID=A0A5B7FPA9_PORTR|nr:hypothetical protein [Portunus trituberculatus]
MSSTCCRTPSATQQRGN